MLKAGNTQYIDRPIAEVFEYVADQTKTTSWCLGMTECRLTTNAGMQNGAKRHIEVKSPLVTSSWDFELKKIEPNKLIIWSDMEAAIPLIDTYTFEEKNGGTEFSHYNEYGNLPMYLRLLKPLFLAKANKTIKKDMGVCT